MWMVTSDRRKIPVPSRRPSRTARGWQALQSAKRTVCTVDEAVLASEPVIRCAIINIVVGDDDDDDDDDVDDDDKDDDDDDDKDDDDDDKDDDDDDDDDDKAEQKRS
ncbi:hypothetical protein ElyMa_001543400 [Elysia marginata]|uniref:Uncharacterized protein n=1 Tax=Elysia marginata TaxID=1093978 RepID=A0AAV4JAF0_9GAST|nr:hypothetical protein ElyMa_001543400 [Elysia marginata]